jgi:hypothetical protein
MMVRVVAQMGNFISMVNSGKWWRILYKVGIRAWWEGDPQLRTKDSHIDPYSFFMCEVLIEEIMFPIVACCACVLMA